jgi:hypothetical protein
MRLTSGKVMADENERNNSVNESAPNLWRLLPEPEPDPEIGSDEATHYRIRYGTQELATFANDGVDRTISVTDSLRLEYRNRRVYLVRT